MDSESPWIRLETGLETGLFFAVRLIFCRNLYSHLNKGLISHISNLSFS